jgi:flagellar L-ring protein FlgH
MTYMRRSIQHMLWSVSAIILSGCALAPQPSVVTVPTTARPSPPARPTLATGSIFQNSIGSRSLFEDRRPRNVGDILTIVISEKINASKNSSSNATRTGSIGLAATFPGVVGKALDGLSNATGKGENKFEGKGDASASNVFTGTISVTVVDVLPNGNLQVAGEKQIAINQGTEFIRFSGVVNPITVAGDGSVPSTTVADARIEYRANGYLDEAQTMGWLQRFFLNVLPF